MTDPVVETPTEPTISEMPICNIALHAGHQDEQR